MVLVSIKESRRPQRRRRLELTYTLVVMSRRRNPQDGRSGSACTPEPPCDDEVFVEQRSSAQDGVELLPTVCADDTDTLVADVGDEWSDRVASGQPDINEHPVSYPTRRTGPDTFQPVMRGRVQIDRYVSVPVGSQRIGRTIRWPQPLGNGVGTVLEQADRVCATGGEQADRCEC